MRGIDDVSNNRLKLNERTSQELDLELDRLVTTSKNKLSETHIPANAL